MSAEVSWLIIIIALQYPILQDFVKIADMVSELKKRLMVKGE